FREFGAFCACNEKVDDHVQVEATITNSTVASG
ncbi:hypothetical protein pipiens_019375, partial [Culex pipiens pipiens]